MVTARIAKKRVTAYAGPTCPACAADLPTPLTDGQQTCRACDQAFTLAAFYPAKDPGPSVLPSGAGTPCARHARNLAVASCGRCGAFMCELCRLDLDGQVLCAACFERLEKEGALASARVSSIDYNGMAFLGGLIGVPMIAFGMIIGPIVLWTVVLGYRQNQKTGDGLSVVYGWIALCLGVLETAVGLLFFLSLLGVATRTGGGHHHL